MKRLAFALALLAAMALAAHAHRLKVFATVEDGALSGYGFFTGGGRPQGSTVIIRDGGEQEVYRGATDGEGRFSWRPPVAADFTVVIDTREGHVAEARISADRFAGGAAVATAPDDARAAPGAGTSSADPAYGAAAAGCASADAALARLVDQAVARQVRPLLESLAAAEGRIRFNDVAGGVGMIVGLTGIGLWAAGRRRERAGGG